MKNLLFFLPICLTVISGVLSITNSTVKKSGEENCDGLGVLLYEDLGCTPEYEKSKKCPISYTCQGLGQWKNQCHFRGKVYDDGEMVNNTLAPTSCDVGCFCSVEAARFVCAILDCWEWFGLPVKSGCYNKYSLDQCCSTGRICCLNNTTPKCHVNGDFYSEGQRIYPRDACFECICQEGFNGKYEKPFCRRRFCGIQLKYSEYLQQVCAPLYSKEYRHARCCPNSWICPTGDENVIGIPKSDKVCYFGNRTLKVGESFQKRQTTIAQVVCECIIPPLLTCVEHY